ncbi:8-oxo-dGTP diphosphatase MutT [Aestuariibacter salexigens]|uniref:8-oxo-dGTP diphosphatase MutT n=1 Tax=Aestuariibacter salexigens TaxID=226010 RepID=UPI0004055A1B|nr:8-oxo-dGTP diphosphatase MutT [Aestuariibacter salexigens]
MKIVDVAVGVIIRDQQIFITKRADDLHQGGKWEFPGGKCEQGESVSAALARELDEEVGIKVRSDNELIVIEHDYGDKKVRLNVHTVERFDGEPHGREGQQSMWCPIDELRTKEFPAANVKIIEALERRD